MRTHWIAADDEATFCTVNTMFFPLIPPFIQLVSVLATVEIVLLDTATVTFTSEEAVLFPARSLARALNVWLPANAFVESHAME